MSASDRFAVLHVCTGNICRSPMAERLTREGLRARAGAEAERFVVESAGTWGLSGSPMDPSAARALEAFGLDGSDFRARELVAAHVAAADLVLCATREHRAAAVELEPSVVRRTFTLREFARLTSVVDPAELPDGDLVDRARALVAAAARRRGTVRPQRPHDDDLADPYRGPMAGFSACAELVEQALRGPLDLLTATVGR